MPIDRETGRRVARTAAYIGTYLLGLGGIALIEVADLWATALATLLAGAVLVVSLGVEIGWDYVDLELPSRRQSLTIVGTLAGYAVVVLVVTGGAAIVSPGVTPADHKVLEPTPTEAPTPSTPEPDGTTSSPPTGTPTTPGDDEPAPSEFDRLLPLFLTAVIAAPFVEELIFRNGLQKALTSRVGGPVALLVTSLVFAGLHGPSYADSALSLLGLAIPLTIIFLTSVLLGLAYWKTENLLVPIAVHALMNFAAVIASVV